MKAGMALDRLAVGIRRFPDVRLHKQLSIIGEQARELRDDAAGSEAALGVPLLPPGIGKMDEDARQAASREPGQRGTNVLGEYPPALGQAEFVQALVHEAR